MTDQNKDTQAGAASQIPVLLSKIQYVKDFSFENPNPLKNLGQLKQNSDIKVGVNVSAQPVKENAYEAVLHIHVEAKNENETAFIADLSYAGVFECPLQDVEQLKPILLIECPRILFPFARQIIAEATANGGYMPLYLQPIDFVQLYQQQKDNIRETPPQKMAQS